MAAQLELPLGELTLDNSAAVRGVDRVYVSRDLKMQRIEWVGFDMDYTLAIYRQEAMDRRSVEATVEKLVERGYPEWLTDVPYPLDFPIRGLLIDKRLGNVLKMNRFKIVRKGYHGMRELSPAELREIYYDKKLRHKSSRYHWIDTLYGLSEACVYAAAIDALEKRDIPVKYRQLFTEIRESIDEAHRDGSIKDDVSANLPAYVERDPQLAHTLHKLRSAGKKLFVLTNSGWEYTQHLMSYLLDDALPDYPTFQHYFDVIIASARKPAFFQDKNPLLELRGEGTTGPAKLPLERGKAYLGGNLRELQAALGVTGNKILYVGDHIYGDMLRSKKDSNWRTAMIIQELAEEVNATEGCREDFGHFDDLYNRRAELEDQLRHFQLRFKELSRIAKETGNREDDVARVKRMLTGIRRQLRSIDSDTGMLRRRIDLRYHPYWGSLLKERNERSLFGDQVSEYACIYTARVSNLVNYSPHQYFRSPRGLMHHEL